MKTLYFIEKEKKSFCQFDSVMSSVWSLSEREILAEADSK